jgi:hypothetical protein
VISIYLIGGLVCSLALAKHVGWFNAYNLGFGAMKLLCPGFESFGYSYMASFFQTVASLYVSYLDEKLYSDWSHIGSQLGSSRESVVNQEYL